MSAHGDQSGETTCNYLCRWSLHSRSFQASSSGVEIDPLIFPGRSLGSQATSFTQVETCLGRALLLGNPAGTMASWVCHVSQTQMHLSLNEAGGVCGAPHKAAGLELLPFPGEAGVPPLLEQREKPEWGMQRLYTINLNMGRKFRGKGMATTPTSRNRRIWGSGPAWATWAWGCRLFGQGLSSMCCINLV